MLVVFGPISWWCSGHSEARGSWLWSGSCVGGAHAHVLVVLVPIQAHVLVVLMPMCWLCSGLCAGGAHAYVLVVRVPIQAQVLVVLVQV